MVKTYDYSFFYLDIIMWVKMDIAIFLFVDLRWNLSYTLLLFHINKMSMEGMV